MNELTIFPDYLPKYLIWIAALLLFLWIGSIDKTISYILLTVVFLAAVYQLQSGNGKGIMPKS